jgi:hypothetical protein
MLAKFRSVYPQGSLVSEFIDIDRGLYLVKVTIEVERIILATGLASGETIEIAEDRARDRAIAAVITERSIQTQLIPNGHSETITAATELTKSSVSPAETPLSVTETEPTRSNLFPTISATPELETELNTPTPLSVTKTEPTRSNSFPTISATPEEPEELNIPTPKAATIPVEPDIDETQPSLFFTMSSSLIDDMTNHEATTIADKVEAPDDGKMSFTEIKHQTDLHIKRLAWTNADGRNFLQARYGKKSRVHLNDEQLLEFLRYLESLPDPS